jgi:hypothetical protein
VHERPDDGSVKQASLDKLHGVMQEATVFMAAIDASSVGARACDRVTNELEGFPVLPHVYMCSNTFG